MVSVQTWKKTTHLTFPNVKYFDDWHISAVFQRKQCLSQPNICFSLDWKKEFQKDETKSWCESFRRVTKMSECKQFTNAMQGNASDYITYILIELFEVKRLKLKTIFSDFRWKVKLVAGDSTM